MGREIVYCFKCQRRVMGDELDKGTAYQVGNKITCSGCAVHLLETLPAREKEQLLAKMFRETKDRQSGPGKRSAAPPSSSTPRAPLPPPAPVRRPGGMRLGVIVGLALGVLVGAVAIVVALSGNRGPAEETRSPSADQKRRQAAEDAVRKARDFTRTRAADVDAQVPLWEDAAFAAVGTPYLAEVTREVEAARIRRRESVAKDLRELDAKVGLLLEKQEYHAALDLLETARVKRALPEWTVEITRKSAAIEDAASKELAKVKDLAADAKRKGYEDEVAQLRSKILRWGLPKSLIEFDRSVAAVPLPKPLEDPALVGYWPLDEGTGTSATDSTGKLVGKITGAAWSPGKFGTALRFDGTGGMLELPNTPELNRVQAGNYALAAWVKIEGRPVEKTREETFAILMKPGYHMGLGFGRYGHFHMVHWTGTMSLGDTVCLHCEGTQDPGTDTFHHVTAVVDRASGTTRVYFDGALDKENKEKPNVPSMEFQNRSWRVGCADPGSPDHRFSAKAVIDEVRIYARALTAAEVELLARARPAAR